MTRLRLGTRDSALALAQSRGVARRLEAGTPGLEVELVEIRTSGDRIRDVPLGPHLGQSFFTKEIEDALLEERVDLAVHSAKDLASVMPAGLCLAAVPEREDPRDALVSTGSGLAELPAGARIGTSSPRRRAFLGEARPNLVVEDLRGNVPTRLAAVDEGRLDAVVLAVSGLRRLGLGERITEILEPDVMLPAPSQGALALQTREDDERTRAIVGAIDDPAAHDRVRAERACLRTLEAGCQAPVGALARLDGDRIELEAALFGPDGLLRTRADGDRADPGAVGAAAARALLEQVGLPSLREAPWAGPPPARTAAPDDDGTTRRPDGAA